MGSLSLVRKPNSAFTKEQLMAKFPEKKGTITDELVEKLNIANNDPSFNADEFISTMVDYKHIMLENRGSLEDYMNAVKFCAYLESEKSATEAYRRARANDEFIYSKVGVSTDSDEYRSIAYVASRYRNNNKMVRAILTQTDMPLYLVFQKARYQAVQTLATEMVDAKFSKDRISAASKLLEHVKAPENSTVELNIGPSADAKSMQDNLMEQLLITASNQKKLLDAGVNIRDVQRLNIKTEVDSEEILDGEINNV